MYHMTNKIYAINKFYSVTLSGTENRGFYVANRCSAET